MRKSFLVILLITVVCRAQWVQVSNGMGNKTVRSLAYSGDNIFAGIYSSTGGVYLSTNNGITWSEPTSVIPYVMSLTTYNNYIFVGSGLNSGIFLSTDNGANWAQTSLNNQNLYSLVSNNNIIFAGTLDNGLYLSTNQGTSWIQSSLNSRSVYSIGVYGNNIFAGYGDTNGVYLSTDNGTNWIQTSLNNRLITALSVDGKNVFAGTNTSWGIYLSTNNGMNWVQTSLKNVPVNSISIIGNTIFAGTNSHGVYVSNNNGTNWIQRNEGLNSLNINAFCILNNYIFAATDAYSVYRRPLSELIGIQPISNEVPNHFSLSQNYPNPFNPNTKIKFDIAKSSSVELKIFDVLGRQIALLVNEELNPGSYETNWNAPNYPSGVYYYQLNTEIYTETKKMILIK